jgi:hypothetical protein
VRSSFGRKDCEMEIWEIGRSSFGLKNQELRKLEGLRVGARKLELGVRRRD